MLLTKIKNINWNLIFQKYLSGSNVHSFALLCCKKGDLDLIVLMVLIEMLIMTYHCPHKFLSRTYLCLICLWCQVSGQNRLGPGGKSYTNPKTVAVPTLRALNRIDLKDTATYHYHYMTGHACNFTSTLTLHKQNVVLWALLLDGRNRCNTRAALHWTNSFTSSTCNKLYCTAHKLLWK